MSTRPTYVAPRNPIEEEIAAIWASHLRPTRIGIHDNFADLGGHSLAATEVVQAIADRFDARGFVQDLIRLPTVAEQANLVREVRHL